MFDFCDDRASKKGSAKKAPRKASSVASSSKGKSSTVRASSKTKKKSGGAPSKTASTTYNANAATLANKKKSINKSHGTSFDSASFTRPNNNNHNVSSSQYDDATLTTSQ